MSAPIYSKKFVCILNHTTPLLGAILLSYVSETEIYTPTFIFPDIPVEDPPLEIDDQSEYAMSIEIGRDASIRIGNNLSRIGEFEYLVLAGLQKKHESYFKFIDKFNVIRVNTFSDIEFFIDPLIDQSKKILLVKEADVLKALSSAILNGYKLQVNEEANQFITYDRKTDGLVIVENINYSAIVIAINYANSINADIKIVKRLSKSNRKEINRLIEQWKNDKSNPDQIALMDLKSQIFECIDGINFSQYSYVTFFTEGIPYTLSYNSKVPASYVGLKNNPDRFVFNNIYFESQQSTNSAILFSPLEFGNDEEIYEILKALFNEKYFVKLLIDEDASVYNLDMSLSLFPFEILHICSHGGEIEGYQREMEFTDRDGNKHYVIWDEVLSFAPSRREELVKVETKQIFRQFDGLDWMSDELLSRGYPRYVFVDMIHATQTDNGKKYSGKPIGIVKDSCGIKCWFSIYQAMTHLVAGQHTAPVIFNNTCWSNGTIKDSLLSSDIRAYIGTFWNVSNAIARKSAEKFYVSVFSGTLLSAFQEIRNETLGSTDEENYIFWGLHFSTLNKAKSIYESELMVVDKMLYSYYMIKDKIETLPPGQNRDYHNRNMDWYYKELMEHHKEIVPIVVELKRQELMRSGLL